MRRGKPPLVLACRRVGSLAMVGVVVLLATLATAAGPPARAEAPTAHSSSLRSSLARAMRSAGPYSGAFVYNASDRRTVFRWRSSSPRIPASNVKLFTAAAALGRFGPGQRLRTWVLGNGRLDENGVWRGNLYLRGGGDPTFGSASFVRPAYGSGATVGRLALRLKRAGVRHVDGRVIGDESRFDSLRGGPGSGYRTSIYVGPLSGLSYNRGLANSRGTAFQRRPPLFAAAKLTRALERRGVPVDGVPRAGRAPRGLDRLASVGSPTMTRLARLMLVPSDNFFAEMLLKGLGARGGARGTTRRGARAATRFARSLRSRARLVDGSGLSRGNRVAPRHVVRLLGAMRRRREFRAFYRSLAVAGRNGTLATRMRRGPARGRCRAKTGTLSNVSALSGYCRAGSGDLYVFSMLMNGVNPSGARSLQDRMAHAIAGRRR